MAPAGWATADQREFLESRVPDFQQAQRSNKTRPFWDEIFSAFFEKWPDQASEVSSATTPTKSKKKKKRASTEDLKPEENLSSEAWMQIRKKVSTIIQTNPSDLHVC
jgi:hypothetical protein